MMKLRGIVCSKCLDGKGRPMRLYVTNTYCPAPGIVIRYRVCPKCHRNRQRTVERIAATSKTLLAVANHA